MEKYIIVKQHECVKYQNLSEEIKEKVRNEHNERLNYFDWYSPVVEGFIEDMREYGVEVDKDNVQFSIGYCQSDGAAWGGELVDIKKYTKDFGDKRFGRIVQALVEHGIIYFIEAKPGRNLYQDSNVEIENYYDEDLEPIIKELKETYEDITIEEIEEAIENFKKDWDEFCKDISKELYDRLVKELEYQTSDEYLKEYFEANNFVFDKHTGEMFHLEEEQYLKLECVNK